MTSCPGSGSATGSSAESSSAEGSAAEGNAFSARIAEMAAREGAAAVVISAAIEEEIAQLEAAERAEFLEALGLHETGLDRLAETDIVGDEEVGPRHVDRANERIELEVLNTHPAPKRRLQEAPVRIGGRPPPHGIQKRFQPFGIVETRDGRQARPFDYMCTWLHLPNHIDLLAEAVFINGRERQTVLGAQSLGRAI